MARQTSKTLGASPTAAPSQIGGPAPKRSRSERRQRLGSILSGGEPVNEDRSAANRSGSEECQDRIVGDVVIVAGTLAASKSKNRRIFPDSAEFRQWASRPRPSTERLTRQPHRGRTPAALGGGGYPLSDRKSDYPHDLDHAQTNLVMPGMGTGATGIGPHSNVLGIRSCFEASICFQVKRRPV